MTYDILVLGSGPAGLAAAVAARGRNKSVLVIGNRWQDSPLAKAERVDNFLGLPGRTGLEMLGEFHRHAEALGVEFVVGRALSLLAWNGFSVTVGSQVCQGRTMVLAPGVVRADKYPGEAEFLGRGVSYCAACDGMFYRGKTAAVVGGGNSAAEDALLLSRICRRVILIHRRDTLRAEQVYRAPLMEADNVQFCWNCQVTELLRGEGLRGVRLRDIKTGAVRTADCDGVFVSIGRRPASQLARGQLRLDPAGYILADESTRTDIPGVFAVGDVRTKALRQIVTAAADGAFAVHFAQEYLSQGGRPV